ncbi:non-hydrolyzing UDP-N-acetylglucosamine 2-epimerase [Oleispirillum naphthae]|uniref:non-hydrolyzing UDP-N-acetylglucosamine 2-epimerase n=1 Tax=Oleispirillum naphthae TaxID=2838853 RepID=UPI00308245A9
MKARIHLVAGARPNFMKVAPLYHALLGCDWAEPVIVHTGQHYSAEMSDVFLRDLGLPRPHHCLNAQGGTHARQTAAVLSAYEDLCLAARPDWTVVAGDVNSTLAACLAARKLDIPVAHLEAGLRSGDRSMPEEINRLLVDAVADLLWTPSEDADANLAREGVPPERVCRVGNLMIDTYCALETQILAAGTAQRLGLARGEYAVVTLHRPVNVDAAPALARIVERLEALAADLPLAFPVHPRTRGRLHEAGLWDRLERTGMRLLDPLGYVDFMNLVEACGAVLTDSGGVQEETSYLGVPCLTLRETTERPVTVTLGGNRLIGEDEILQAVPSAVAAERVRRVIPLWDGHAAPRAARSLRERIEGDAR